MFLKITLLVLFLLLNDAAGSCGNCQSNSVACQSESTFSPCVEGTPTDSVVACPVGKVCTAQQAICVSNVDDSVTPSCITGCGVCGSYGKVFSCESQTTFAFCFGEEQPFYTSRGSCLDGYVCDLSSRKICVRDTVSRPSCNAETTPDPDPNGDATSSTSPDPPATDHPGSESSSTTLDPSTTDHPGDGSTSSIPDPPGDITSSTTLDPSATDAPGDGSSSSTPDPSATDPQGSESSSTSPDPSATDPPGSDSSSTTQDPQVTDPTGSESSSTTSEPSATDPTGDGSSSSTPDPSATDPPGSDSSSTTRDPSATDPPASESSSTTPDPSITDPPGDTTSSTSSDPPTTDHPGSQSSSTTLDPSATDHPGDGSTSSTPDPIGDITSSTTLDPSATDASTTHDPTVTDTPGDGSSSSTPDPSATDPPGSDSSSTTPDPQATDPPGSESSSTTPDPSATDPPASESSSTTPDPSVTDPPEDTTSSTSSDPPATDHPGSQSSSTTLDPSATDHPGDESTSSTPDPPGDITSSTTLDPSATDAPGDGSSSSTPDPSATDPPASESSTTTPDPPATDPPGGSSSTPDPSATDPPGSDSSSTTSNPSPTDPPLDGSSSSTLDPPATDSPGSGSSSTTEDPTTEPTTTRAPRDATTFCSETATSGTYKAEGDPTCTKYYICVASSSGYRGFEYICTNPHYFNSATGQCQAERPIDCPEAGSSSTSPNLPETTQDSTSTDPILVETTTRAPRDAATFCSETAASGTFKAEGDPTCTKYYVCVSLGSTYTGFEHTCANSNYFNYEISQCQAELPDDCREGGSSSIIPDPSVADPPGISSTNPESTSTFPTTTQITTRAPRNAITFCSETAASGTFKAEGDPTCTKYYVCVSLGSTYTGFEHTCANSNYFNYEISQCQAELPDDCREGGSSSIIPNPSVADPPGAGSSSTNQDSTSTFPTTTQTTTRAPRNAPTFCSETAASGTFKAEGDPTCTKYYVCVSLGSTYTGFEHSCANSNYFNYEISQCQAELPADCREGGSSFVTLGFGSSSTNYGSTSTVPATTHAPRGATTFCSETSASGTFKAEGDPTCTKYYICVASSSGYRGFEYTCTNPNYFNSERAQCQTMRPENC